MGTDFLLHPRFGVGDAMAIFTGVFYGGYFLFTERSRTFFDPVSHIWLVGIGSSISLYIINAVLGNALIGYPAQTWVVFLMTAVVSQVIGYVSLAYALGYLPASVVAPTVVLQPILTALLAIPLLGEIPTIWQGIGGAIALIGIYIVNRSHQRSTPQSSSVDHRNQVETPMPNA
jgi:drug/metabolite transporter (DMT)-like permease